MPGGEKARKIERGIINTEAQRTRRNTEENPLPFKRGKHLAPGNDSCYRNDVSTIQEIESAVSRLSEEELAAFRGWFAKFDAEVWDRQFEKDVHAGRLGTLADEALRDLDEGRCGSVNCQ